MDIQLVFGQKMFLSKCPDESFYTNETLQDSIEKVYRIPEVQDKVDTSQKGRALTSVGAGLNIATLPGIEQLMQWIYGQILEVATNLNLSGSQLVISRGWTNRMFKGCEGRCHTHPSHAHGIVIFYYQIPENSAELILIDGGTNGSEYHDYPAVKKHHIIPSAGQLIIHHPSMPHAVSCHNNNEPRTCFIFEFELVN
jgi:hypothetical protein